MDNHLIINKQAENILNSEPKLILEFEKKPKFSKRKISNNQLKRRKNTINR